MSKRNLNSWKKIRRQPWSDEELNILKKLYPCYLRGEVTEEDILKVLPCRTWKAIVHKACEENIHLSDKDKVNYEYLRELRKRGIEI